LTHTSHAPLSQSSSSRQLLTHPSLQRRRYTKPKKKSNTLSLSPHSLLFSPALPFLSLARSHDDSSYRWHSRSSSSLAKLDLLWNLFAATVTV
ncbi:unnamed protein product, partial [Prunus brigantina]